MTRLGRLVGFKCPACDARISLPASAVAEHVRCPKHVPGKPAPRYEREAS